MKWQRALQHVVFAFCYPRLDLEVSKKMNHLLKVPDISVSCLWLCAKHPADQVQLQHPVQAALTSSAALVQAPFCVHPKTGKVCVPIDAQASEKFDPEDVPTVQELVQAQECRKSLSEV
jgi:DNA primase small subunit